MIEVLQYVCLSFWLISILFSITIMIIAFIGNDKEGFMYGIQCFILFTLTGYITFVPIIIAATLHDRFKD